MIAGEKDDKGLVLKIAADGTTIWDKKYSSGGYNENFNDIVETNDNCFVITGYYGTSWTTRDILCIKISQSGDTIWSKKIAIGTYSVGLSVQQTADSGFIIGGLKSQNGTPSSLMVVIKLDKNGTFSWAKTFSADIDINFIFSIKQTPDGGYIANGSIQNFSPGESTAILIKFTANGTVSWAFKPTVLSTNGSYAGDVIIKNDGLFFDINTITYGTLFFKTNFSGNVLWCKSYPQTFLPQSFEMPQPTLTSASDGGYLIMSGFYGSSYVLKIDSAGYPIWTQQMLLIAADIAESGDHGIMALGNGPVMGVIMADILNPQIGIIKMDSVGNSIGCVFGGSPYYSDFTLELTPVTLTTGNDGTETILHPSITDASLTTVDQCITVTGKVQEKNNELNLLSVVPNPNKGKFQITGSDALFSGIKKIEIYNTMGEKIYESYNVIIAGKSIDLSSSPSGIYFLQIETEGKLFSRKFIIEQ